MSLGSVIEPVVAKMCNIQWRYGFVYAFSPSYASHAICDTYHPSMSVHILLYYWGEVEQFAKFRWEALLLPWLVFDYWGLLCVSNSWSWIVRRVHQQWTPTFIIHRHTYLTNPHSFLPQQKSWVIEN